MSFRKKRQPPLTKNFQKESKMKVYKYITILIIVLLGIFCGRNWGQSLAPDTFLYPAACFGLALIAWGSDYETAFRNDR